MKEVILTKPPYMNASEQRIADMHSALNILNVLIGELSLIKCKSQDLMERATELCQELDEIAREIKEGGRISEMILRIGESELAVMAVAEAALNAETLSDGKAAIQESISNLKSVFAVLDNRLKEFELRAGDPDVWVLVDPAVFKQQLKDVFVAIAQNSKGRYNIHFDLALKGQGDYYFDINIDVQRADGQLWIPLRLIDVLRDLAANARKYTPPGGEVTLSLSQCENSIRAVVEDNGCGIPDDEIEKVAEFGYRASNVRQRPTFGGGFGLTKAVWLVTGWGGSLTIRSEVDAGTAIRLSLPNIDLHAAPVTLAGG
jgi:signal transduction histidine kinase